MSKRRRLTKEERQQVYQKCNGHCAYCGCELEYKDMQVEHITPLYRGGKDELSNMLPACRSCNHYKGTMTTEEFREYLSQIPMRLMRDSVPFQIGARFGIVKYEPGIEFYFEQRKRQKKTRRIDRIRSMSVYEMADALKETGMDNCIEFCSSTKEYSDYMEEHGEATDAMCRECLIKWLEGE